MSHLTPKSAFYRNPPHRTHRIVAPLVTAALALSVTHLRAAPIVVSNASFETPDVAFAQSYDTNPATPWQITQTTAQQVGAFDNTVEGSEDHIDNADGAQVAFMFVGPGITLFQELTTPGSTFEIGKSYTFTIGAGGNPSLPDDAQLQLRLFYFEGANKVTVAMNSFAFDPSRNPEFITHLDDYSVTSFTIGEGDLAVGRNIGVEIATPGTASFAYWDLDKARVDAVPEPSSLFLLGTALLGMRLPGQRRS